MGYGPWDHKESDTTDQLTLSALYYIYMGLPGGSDSKESTCNAGGLGSVPGLGRSPGEEMATNSSILAWRIPWKKEPSRLLSD